MSEYCRDDFGLVEQADDDFKMWQGLVGPHYTPSVSEDGTLSWSNDGQLPNPEDVSIKGPPGEPGPPGAPGPGVPAGGTTAQLLVKASDEDFDTEWIDQPEMDAGHVSYDPTEAYDDGTVGKELGTINSALSSLASVTEIIDTASGAIASFPDGSGLPMRSLVAEINPVQDLHGQSNPWPAGGGKNKCLPYTDRASHSGISYTIENQKIKVSGTASGASYSWVGASHADYANCPIKLTAGTYTFTSSAVPGANQGEGYLVFSGYKESGGAISNVVLAGTDLQKTVTFSENVGIFYGFYVASGISVNITAQIQIESGSTATAWSPYSNECPIAGHTGLSVFCEEQYDQSASPKATVSWQDEAGTVYGGTLDVVSGLLTVEYASYTIDENQSFTNRISNQGRVYFELLSMASDYNGLTDGRCVCDKLVKKNTENNPAQPLGITVGANSRYVYIGGVTYIPEVTDINSLKTWLGSNNITFTYKLATPQTYQLTPQQILTLLGNNTVFVDTGAVTVTYQASIKGYIDKVLAS